ncbi:MAG: hypothetical protein U0263_04390 [Polyangiaceae bacterium]
MSKWLGLVCCVMVFTAPFGCDDSSDSNASRVATGAAGSGGTAGAATGGAGGSGGTTMRRQVEPRAVMPAQRAEAQARRRAAPVASGGISDAGDGATCQALGTSCTLPTQCCSNKCGRRAFAAVLQERSAKRTTIAVQARARRTGRGTSKRCKTAA